MYKVAQTLLSFFSISFSMAITREGKVQRESGVYIPPNSQNLFRGIQHVKVKKGKIRQKKKDKKKKRKRGKCYKETTKENI